MALPGWYGFAAYALPLIDELHSLPGEARWGEWLDRLGTLATRTLRQPDRVLAILAELAPMAPVGPIELSKVLIVLRSLLLETAVSPPVQRRCRRRVPWAGESSMWVARARGFTA